MSSFFKIITKSQKLVESNYLTIQLYFSIAFITFLYLALEGEQQNIFIAIVKGLFWPIAALLKLLLP